MPEADSVAAAIGPEEACEGGGGETKVVLHPYVPQQLDLVAPLSRLPRQLSRVVARGPAGTRVARAQTGAAQAGGARAGSVVEPIGLV
jgi:hypothetical protein